MSIMSIKELLKSRERTKQTVVHDSFDEMTYCDIKDSSEQLKQQEEKDFPTLKNLLFDTFNSFYKYAPKFHDDKEIREDFVINKEILAKAQGTEQFKKLRGITQLDEVNSAVATVSFVDELLYELHRRQPGLHEQIWHIQTLQKQLLQAIQGFAETGLTNYAIEGRARKIANAQQELQQSVEQIKQNISQAAVSQALHKSADKTSEVNHSLNALSWGTGASSLKKVPAEERMRLAERLLSSQKLFKLVRELGKMKRLATTSRREKIRQQTSEIYDIALGNDINHVIPSELVKLKHPILRKDFLRRYSEKQLLQYALREKEQKGRGDFVVCLDISGSMSGEKEIWGKAVSLAALELAVREKRNYGLITFSERVKELRSYNRKNQPTLTDIIGIAEETWGGGTDFEAPLIQVMSYLFNQESNTKENKKADILFITDGEAEISNEFEQDFNKFKEETKTKVISVQIGDASTRTLQKFSDKVIAVSDLYKAAREVFVNVG